MAEAKITFNAADDYERYMGRWSRAVGQKFLDWVTPPNNARWLDVGCGTGAFSELIAKRCAPQSISGIDPSPEQIAYATKAIPTADFRVGSADALPFPDDAFDVVASALVLHFLPDRIKALREMRRVARPGAIVAGYTWQRTASEAFAPYAPMKKAIQAAGAEFISSPLVPEANPTGLSDTLRQCGFTDFTVDTIKVSYSYENFADYWDTMALAFSPTGKSMAAMTEEGRAKLRAHMMKALPADAAGRITYSSQAIAFKTRK
jgi:SAM-dependent methyltransferase